MSYANRIFLYGPVGALVLFAGAYALFWYVSANMLAARLDAANGGDIAPGITFAFAEKSVGGFPFRLDVLLSGVTVAQQGTAGEFAWRAERIAFHKLTYRNDRFILEADGLQSLSWPGADGRPRIGHVTPGIARASAILEGGKLTRLDVEFRNLSGRDASLDAPAERTFAAANAQAHFLRQGDDTIAFVLSGTSVKIAPAFGFPLGSEFPQIHVDGNLIQAKALDALLAGEEGFAVAAERWRNATGVVNVTGFTLTSDLAPSGAILQGMLTLGPSHRFVGVLESSSDEEAGLRLTLQDGAPGG